MRRLRDSCVAVLLVALGAAVSAPAAGAVAEMTAQSTEVTMQVAADVSVGVAGCGAGTHSLGAVPRGGQAVSASACAITAGTSNNPNGVTVLAQDGSASQGLVSGGNVIPDYVAATNNWAGTGSLFGACLESVTSMTPLATMSGSCPATDGAPWFGLGSTDYAIARTNAAGVTGTANLRFGARVGAAQPKGAYSGTITVTAVANP
jgi:hypothetical protein